MLTAERLRSIFDYDAATGVFTSKVRRSNIPAGTVAGCTNPSGYQVISVDGRLYYCQRLAWLHVHGEWPLNEIDHIDVNRSNNKLLNLRVATHSQNLGNQGKHRSNTSTRKGVSFHKGARKWMASITKDGKQIYLGLHETVDAAHAAYREAATSLFGEFARTE